MLLYTNYDVHLSAHEADIISKLGDSHQIIYRPRQVPRKGTEEFSLTW